MIKFKSFLKILGVILLIVICWFLICQCQGAFNNHNIDLSQELTFISLDKSELRISSDKIIIDGVQYELHTNNSVFEMLDGNGTSYLVKFTDERTLYCEFNRSYYYKYEETK